MERRGEHDVMRRRLFWIIFVPIVVLTTHCLAQSGKLRPSDTYLKNRAYYEDVAGVARLHVSRLSKNRKLASIGDTLYMLDRRNKIVWKWSSDGGPIYDVPVVDPTGTIYVIGYDMMWVAIDAATGQLKWNSTAVGRASYSQIKPYRKDMYLVVTDMSGYRFSRDDKTIEDEVSLCRGNDVMWESKIPANSRIKLLGNRAFVVFRRGGRTVSWPLRIPATLRRPIGHVSSGHVTP